MESPAKHALLVDVEFVKKCGIYFNFMLELAKNPNAPYLDAGLYIINLH